GSSRGPPSSSSDRSASPDKSETNAAGSGGAFSTLATAAAVAEAKVGVMSPTGRAVHAFAQAGGDEPGGSSPVSSGSRESGREPHATNAGAVAVGAAAAAGAVALAAGSGKGSKAAEEGEEEKSPYPAPSVRPTSPSRFGGAASGFGCLAPQLSPRMACSRLPQIDDCDDDDDEDTAKGSGRDGGGGGGGDDLVGPAAASAAALVSLDHRASLTLSRSRTMSSDLSPIAEVAIKESFTDSETESEVSSRASSLSGARVGGRRAPRDPAALLAAALQRAGQIAAIPPPSGGSPAQIGRPLSAVQEVPMEAIPLPGLFTPTATACSTPRQGAGGSWGGDESTAASSLSPRAPADTAATPIPSPASRPGVLVFGEYGGGPVRAAATGASVKASHSVDRSPARSREEAEDEREEHRIWEKAMEGKTASDADGDGARSLESPSAGNAGGSTAQATIGSAVARNTQHEQEAGAAAGFSLVGTLIAFFGRKRSEVPAPAILGNRDAPAARIDVPEGSESSDFMQSPESNAVETWPDAIVEDGSKSSLDEGFVDVAVSEVAVDDEADDE
ncbi:unnamed protein product, partial [Hapterophycus canaliculatus]